MSAETECACRPVSAGEGKTMVDMRDCYVHGPFSPEHNYGSLDFSGMERTKCASCGGSGADSYPFLKGWKGPHGCPACHGPGKAKGGV